ncbi:hypothetical protein J6524_25145 [Bradyrhizobium sp. WSM 1738]|uniref:hypothetical protein n=1 Tax=Bradyrhizobium hereditatis TaxID=2821405 RepID=UPI001CE3A8AD|nr:hypothetical protein [Bradyrhizobium hereditatis]MCA6118138.1 hypothetical protein [Bradyrhizobium hereditatis]
MSDLVKIRLRSGDAEIELEGARSDVDHLLERWWQQLGPSKGRRESPEGGSGREERKASSRRPAPAVPTDSKTANGPDPTDVANRVKESEHFRQIERKILHAPRDLYNKAAFPLWFSDEALTSGAVHRILEALDVRIDLPSISRVMKKHSKQFLLSGKRQRGGAPSAYRLTANARSEFQKWLMAEDADRA